jgi:uncharacterized protein (DUF433 family)
VPAERNPVDLYDQPAYKGPEAAHMLAMPLSTLRAWSFGQSHASGEVARRFRALIRPADFKGRLLSFNNLCELHTLAAIRRHFHVPMPAVRDAIAFVGTELGTKRPLLSSDFRTNGIHLFVKRAGQTLNASRRGQFELGTEFVRDLSRISRDANGKVVKLFPSTRLSAGERDQSHAVVIDPKVSFGRPVLARGGVRTEVIQDRFIAGDSPREMAEDFGVDEAAILEALRFEQRLAA